ncbi:MAG TPA: SHOCT domain-containing protein [Coriobacteriia bacterium]|jgi:putative membrane protein
MMFGYGFDGFWMLFMGFFMLIGTVGVILLVVWLARLGSPAGRQWGGSDEALEVARRRYAAGEITKEQYDEIVHTLRR